jgi:hypothetical protein
MMMPLIIDREPEPRISHVKVEIGDNYLSQSTSGSWSLAEAGAMAKEMASALSQEQS